MSEDDLSGRIVVFAGPSLPRRVRPPESIFAWLPPAIAGDAARLSGRKPRAVVLIDGLFDESPAIRHKELLVLVSEGIPVLGAASMGALRAAELHAFGMIGVGQVFFAFANGRLDGDDEVALVHGPAEWDWTPLSVPLINVRATLTSAVRSRICDSAAARAILRQAATLFYKDRTWPAIFEALAREQAASSRRLKALEHWLPTGQVDLKQRDALACLTRSLGVTSIPPRPPPPDTLFSMALAHAVGV